MCGERRNEGNQRNQHNQRKLRRRNDMFVHLLAFSRATRTAWPWAARGSCTAYASVNRALGCMISGDGLLRDRGYRACRLADASRSTRRRSRSTAPSSSSTRAPASSSSRSSTRRCGRGRSGSASSQSGRPPRRWRCSSARCPPRSSKVVNHTCCVE